MVESPMAGSLRSAEASGVIPSVFSAHFLIQVGCGGGAPLGGITYYSSFFRRILRILPGGQSVLPSLDCKLHVPFDATDLPEKHASFVSVLDLFIAVHVYILNVVYTFSVSFS